jgi:hypothetical protein
MAKLEALGGEVTGVDVGSRRFDAHTIDDFDAIPLEPHELLGVVRE